jgi:hypothetical protein
MWVPSERPQIALSQSLGRCRNSLQEICIFGGHETNIDYEPNRLVVLKPQ